MNTKNNSNQVNKKQTMKNARIYLFLLSCMIITGASAQGWITPVNLSEKAPASPNSASLGKYFDYPVNYATGLPDIQIPLYTVKSGNIVIPIILKYHPGGVSLNDNASWVGTGWSLEAGGTVSRRINGLDDFAQTLLSDPSATTVYNYFNTDFTNAVNYAGLSMPFSSITAAVDLHGSPSAPANSVDALFVRVAEGKMDGEADDYFFSNPEGGGRFIYSQKQGKFRTDKISGWQFSASNAGTTPNWQLWNPSGTMSYHYALTETNIDPRISQETYGWYYGVGLPYELTGSTSYLTAIDDLQHNKSVTISYNNVIKLSYTGVNISKEYAVASTTPLIYNFFSSSAVMGRRWGTEAVIKDIIFDNGKVEFIQDTEPRADSGVNALKEIRVLDKLGNVVKRILFNYYYTAADYSTTDCFASAGVGFIAPSAYYGAFTKRLFLGSVQDIVISGSDTIKNNPYRFTYFSEQALPSRFSFGQDHWGYYNGKISNQTLIPNSVMVGYSTPGAGGGADREVDSNYNQMGNIREIYYPTLGKSIFEFQSNRDNTGLKGGLRIKRITNYDNVGKVSIVKEYDYRDNSGVESGRTLFPRQEYAYNYFYDPYSGTGAKSILRLQSQSTYPLYSAQGRPVMYTQVAERQISSDGDLVTKHYYTDPVAVDTRSEYGVPNQKTPAEDNFSGLEYKQEVYRRKVDGTYEILQKDETEFDALNGKSDYIWNVQAYLAEPGMLGWLVSPGSTPISGSTISIPAATNIYKTLLDQSVPVAKYQVSNDGVNSLTTPTFYNYDITNSNTRVVKTVNSEGDTLIRTAKFASDYAAGDAGIQGMVDRGMVTAPVEVSNFIKKPGGGTAAKLTGSILYEYDGLNVKKVYKLFPAAPLTDFVESYVSGTFTRDTRYELMQEVLSRDADNNPLTVKSNTGLETYIWDYTTDITTAVVKNAGINDVAYTSFEADGGGNWSVGSTARDATTAVTGHNAYELSSGSISSVKPLTGGTHYVLSYWSRNGQYSVSGSGSVAPGMTVDGWTFYEHQVTGVTSLTVSGSGKIDELRLHPQDALMVSLTYDPLIGMTSQTDAADRITYYEYDSFNRLRTVRNQQKEIIKQICYNYAGQQVGCDGTNYYYNEPQSKVFYSASCASGYSGTAITYFIPAGTYAATTSVADANAQAVADVNSNGQNYADNHGACKLTYFSAAIATNIVKANCAGGYVGSTVPVSIAAGAFTSTISQEDADAKANAGAIGYANSTGSCTFTGIYFFAKMSVVNESGGYGDVQVEFFSDAAMTNPVSVTNLIVNYQEDQLNDVSMEHTYVAHSFLCNGTSAIVAYSVPTLSHLYLYGAYINIYYSYTLTDGTPSSAYTIIP